MLSRKFRSPYEHPLLHAFMLAWYAFAITFSIGNLTGG